MSPEKSALAKKGRQGGLGAWRAPGLAPENREQARVLVDGPRNRVEQFEDFPREALRSERHNLLDVALRRFIELDGDFQEVVEGVRCEFLAMKGRIPAQVLLVEQEARTGFRLSLCGLSERLFQIAAKRNDGLLARLLDRSLLRAGVAKVVSRRGLDGTELGRALECLPHSLKDSLKKQNGKMY
jgi:hypothetical protein